LPLPEPVQRFWVGKRTAFAHPVYPLLRTISWHADWKYDPPKGSRGRGVRAAAYGRATELFSHPEMKQLAKAVIARRAAWVGPLVRDGLARCLVLRAATDVVLHLSSPGPLELGLAVHHVYGFPFLPATAIKGLAHALAAAADMPLAEVLYGRQDSAGRVAVLDGLPLEFEVRRDVMTPHFSAWYQRRPRARPDDTGDPTPIPFLSVSAGSTFEVVLLARVPDTAETDLATVEGHVRQGCEERGLGAKTSAGYGAFVVTRSGPHPSSAAGGAAPASETTGDHESAGPQGSGSSRATSSPVQALIEQVSALSPGRVAGEIARFVDACLKLQLEEEQRQLARAIVGKATVRYIRDRIKAGKRPDAWQKILDLAGEKAD
jgi:CRISPR-associated protein Cmr6